MNVSQIEVLEQMAQNIFTMEAQLRQQTYSLISAILREHGGEIRVSNGYHTAGVKMSNVWYEVHKLILVEDTNFEVYFYDEDSDTVYDLEDIEAFDTTLFGEQQEYSASEMLYFLQNFMLSELKAKQESEVANG